MSRQGATGEEGTSVEVDDREARPEVEQLVLRDGSSVVIRPLVAGAEAAIANWYANWFAGLSPETLFARLFLLRQRFDPRAEPALARVHPSRHEAIMAFAGDGVTVGIARWLHLGKPNNAEVTVAVADDWRGRGLASMLLERVAARARSVGIEQLSTSCPATDHTLIRLLSRLGHTTVGPSNRGLLDVQIDLSSAAPDPGAGGN